MGTNRWEVSSEPSTRFSGSEKDSVLSAFSRAMSLRVFGTTDNVAYESRLDEWDAVSVDVGCSTERTARSVSPELQRYTSLGSTCECDLSRSCNGQRDMQRRSNARSALA